MLHHVLKITYDAQVSLTHGAHIKNCVCVLFLWSLCFEIVASSLQFKTQMCNPKWKTMQMIFYIKLIALASNTYYLSTWTTFTQMPDDSLMTPKTTHLPR